MARPPATLGDLALPCPLVDSHLTVVEANGVFEENPWATSVAVRTPGGLRLLTRLHLRDLLGGGLGYGWALNQHRRIETAVSDQEAMQASTPLDVASRIANGRPHDHRYDDLLVLDGTRLRGVVPVSRLLGHLADFYAHRARHDALTGVLSRAAIYTHLIELIDSAAATVSVAYFDLDGFKQINDRHGHAAGDHVLRGIANSLHRAIGHGAQVGRYGGDEFVAVLTGLSVDEVVRRLEHAVASISEPIPDVDGRVTASAGVAFADEGLPAVGQHQADHLLQAADQAMYLAKSGGGNQLVLAPSTHPAPAVS